MPSLCSGITYKASASGSDGNAITVTLQNDATATGIEFSLTDSAVTVSFESDITGYTQQNLIDAYTASAITLKNLLVIEISSASTNLTELASFSLEGGQDEILAVLQRGLYAGMNETELVTLRADLRKALTDLISGKQIVSVAIAGKQVTKKLAELHEVKAELASVNTALQQFDPQNTESLEEGLG